MHREEKEINIKEVMDSWILQKGYPMVTISKKESRGDAVTIHQEHFLYDTDTKIHHHQLNRRYRPIWHNINVSTTAVDGDLLPPDDLWNPELFVKEE